MGNRVLPIIKDRITDTGEKIYLILRKKINLPLLENLAGIFSTIRSYYGESSVNHLVCIRI